MLRNGDSTEIAPLAWEKMGHYCRSSCKSIKKYISLHSATIALQNFMRSCLSENKFCVMKNSKYSDVQPQRWKNSTNQEKISFWAHGKIFFNFVERRFRTKYAHHYLLFYRLYINEKLRMRITTPIFIRFPLEFCFSQHRNHTECCVTVGHPTGRI